MPGSKPIRHIALKTVSNLRDLGGYETPYGAGYTQFGRILRSDAPVYLEDEEKYRLKRLGVQTVVDLRTLAESEAEVSSFHDVPGVKIHNLPLDFDAADTGRAMAELGGDFTLGSYYVALLRYGRKAIAGALDLCARAPGLLIVHCAVGKDRTGVIAALALLAAGVSETDVLADYMLSDLYTRALFADGLIETVHTKYRGAHTGYMEQMLDYLRKNGGADAYFEEISGGRSLAEALRGKLTHSM